jgi:hypothetical protein
MEFQEWLKNANLSGPVVDRVASLHSWTTPQAMMIDEILSLAYRMGTKYRITIDISPDGSLEWFVLDKETNKASYNQLSAWEPIPDELLNYLGTEVMHLTQTQSEFFADLLINPQEPNQALIDLFAELSNEIDNS